MIFMSTTKSKVGISTCEVIIGYGYEYHSKQTIICIDQWSELVLYTVLIALPTCVHVITVLHNMHVVWLQALHVSLSVHLLSDIISNYPLSYILTAFG